MTTPASPGPNDESRPLRVFVNERGVDVPPGATALDAVRAHDPAEAEGVARGDRGVTDSRGLAVDAATPTYAGAIYRTVSARRPTASAEDAA